MADELHTSALIYASTFFPSLIVVKSYLRIKSGLLLEPTTLEEAAQIAMWETPLLFQVRCESNQYADGIRSL